MQEVSFPPGKAGFTQFGFSETRGILKASEKRRRLQEMSNDKVKCQRCGKMMVPRVVFSRGWYLGWGLRLGGVRPKSNICPFCLSEDWNIDRDSSMRADDEYPNDNRLIGWIITTTVIFVLFYDNLKSIYRLFKVQP